jgi:hypothetical protein
MYDQMRAGLLLPGNFSVVASQRYMKSSASPLETYS